MTGEESGFPNNKSGAPKGNANAQKGTDPADAKLACRCTADNKALWQNAANAAGTDGLTAWVVNTLNRAAARELKKATTHTNEPTK